MEQTPPHELHNPDLLAVLPKGLKRVVEVGSSSGALAREYKRLYPGCHYTGIEVDERYAELSRRYCDEVLCADIEGMEPAAFDRLFPSECWIFGDSLEHLRDPWSLLKKVRSGLAHGGAVAACIPNAQHWSLQARLNCGLLRYEDSGLLDRTHLRWFTRTTVVELFDASGFVVEQMLGRVFDEPEREKVLEPIREMAAVLGADPRQAAQDATPLQWVVRAVAR